MKKTLLALTFLIGLLAVNPAPAYACSCVMPGTPQEEMENAAAVFSGTVVDIESADYGYEVTLQVANAWKNIDSSFVTVRTGMGGGDCGFNFVEGETYMVYAVDSYSNPGELEVTICSLTSLLADADVSSLGEAIAIETTADSGNFPYIVTALALTLAAYTGIYMYKR